MQLNVKLNPNSKSHSNLIENIGEYFQSEWYWKFAYDNYGSKIINDWQNMDLLSSKDHRNSPEETLSADRISNDNTINTSRRRQQHQQPQQQRKGVWSSPFLDCGITKTWLISYIVPFYGFNSPTRLM